MSRAGPLAEFVREGMRLYNAGRYWEAHEAWERVWREAPPDERAVWQGLIQAAAAMLHRERDNAHGVRVQGEAALARLAPPPSPGFPLETSRFAASLARCVRDGGPVPRIEPAAGAAGAPDDGTG